MLACNNAVLPGQRKPFLLNDLTVGWVAPDLIAALLHTPAITVTADATILTDPAALPDLAHELARAGLFRWRGESFDVRASADGAALAQIDRGAIPAFGIQAAGVHVNGLVHRADGLYLWVARRARNKLLDPGKLDHIVAGGVPAGLGPVETLIKEAAEEAGIPAELARAAIPVGSIEYTMDRHEGLRRDCVYCFDLTLPEGFLPHAADGEVEDFELWPVAKVMETVRQTDNFKFNVNLVLIDLFIRQQLLPAREAESLAAALRQPPNLGQSSPVTHQHRL